MIILCIKYIDIEQELVRLLKSTLWFSVNLYSGVIGGRTAWVTPSRGDTRRKNIVGKFIENSGRTRSER